MGELRLWVGATPLRVAGWWAVFTGVLVGTLTFIPGAYGGLNSPWLFTAWMTVMNLVFTRLAVRSSFPDPFSTWSDLDAKGKLEVQRAVRTGEVPDDVRIASAVIERVRAIEESWIFQNPPGPRAREAQAEAVRVLDDASSPR
jgi:hypothetical protein